MVDLDVFPTDISAGSKGGPGYSTIIITTASGREQRIQNWNRSRGRWNVGYGVTTQEQWETLLDFIHARAGAARGFLYFDFFDNSSAPAPGDTIATGDGTTTVFQLVRSYTSGGVTRQRNITRPQSGTVSIYLNGAVQASGWSVDTTTGLVTFTSAPGSGVTISAVFQFYVPARFESDYQAMDLDGITGAWNDIAVLEILEP